MNKKILVIGATGTIGGSVCKFLQDENADFIALARNEEKAKILQQKGIKTAIGDLNDKNSLRNAMEGMDKIFLLSVTSPDLPILHGNAAKIAQEKGIRHIVKISARGAAVNANFNIGRFHGVAEQEIKEAGIPYTSLQPHSFLQNLFFDQQSIKEKNAIYSSMGNGKIPMIDTRDIAAVAVKALLTNGHEYKSYILTGPEAVSYQDIADELTNMLGRKIYNIAQTSDEAYKDMMSWGMPEWLVDDMTNLNKMYSKNLGSEVSPAVEQILGRKPLSLKQFMKDFGGKFE